MQGFFLANRNLRAVDTDTAARKLRRGEHLQVCLGSPGSTMPSTLPMGLTGRAKLQAGAGRLASSTPGALNSGRKNLSLGGSGFKPPAKVRLCSLVRRVLYVWVSA
jgi:hypothetical protein